ncbi:MAG: hypothetical protein IT365_11590 [Candidatus Hydrogenedentes bacterium]|nr:hypothetical protein [Candidatus Hydrogenedentota bacterium]
MDRRTFMELMAAGGGWVIAGRAFSAESAVPKPGRDVPYSFDDLFPPLPPVRQIVACPLAADLPWDAITALTCFQGLVNRDDPRIYFIGEENDQYWLDHYHARYGLKVTSLEEPFQLFARFPESCKGYVLCDDGLLDTVNIATLQGGLSDCIPATPRMASRLQALGLAQVDDLTGRWTNRREAYAWALDNLFAKANQRLIGGACVDYPSWTATGVLMRDFLVAHRVFTCDLSASKRDREEYALSERVFAAAQAPGCALGWRCICCNEHEYVALAARHGHSVLCALNCRNLTIHQAIEKPTKPRVQRRLRLEDLPPTKAKTYITFMNTDGDAVWSMLQRNAKRFDEPDHGALPYNWGVLPIATELMPGVLDHLYELKTESDYFVAPTSGALYTYPYLHPDAAGYLRESQRYLHEAGLRVSYIANWDDDFWWQEIDLPDLVPLLRETLPDCLGFMRGMGASAFERDYLGGGAPYIYCGEAIHRDSNVYQTLCDFIDANPNRPLFWFCLVNHNVTLATIREAVKRLPKREVRVVQLDEFFLRIRDAYDRGLIGGGTLYPDKRGVIEIMRKEAVAAWPALMKTLSEHAARASVPEATFFKGIDDPILAPLAKHHSTPPADVVAFTAIWDSMALTRLALGVRGLYANNKARAVQDFAAEFSGVPGAELVGTLWKCWNAWNEYKPDYPEAADAAKRLTALADWLALTLRLE